MKWRSREWKVLAAAILFSTAGMAWGFGKDWDIPAYYAGGADIRIPAQRREKEFKPSENRANFTHLEGVENARVEDGVLKFVLASEKATLGWGNYSGLVKAAAHQDVLPANACNYRVELSVRQSGGKSVWTACPWADNRRLAAKSAEKTLDGSNPATLVLGTGYDSGAPIVSDGFELEVRGARGTAFEISSVKTVQDVCEGYIRKEFVIPEGRIWKAVAYVGAQKTRSRGVQFYLNGKEIERNGAWLYHTESLDVSRYLKNGRNCAGLYGFAADDRGVMMFFKITVIMESGQIIACSTDLNETCRYSPHPAENWATPGFDDSGWTPMGKKNGMGSLILYSRTGSPVPEYAGRIVLRNPAGRYLFYPDASDVRMQALVPKGLQEKKPILAYEFGRAMSDGTTRETTLGLQKTFAVEGNSLVYDIPLGKLSAGIYTVALQLRSGEEVLEERPREPLVVAKRISGKPVSGRDITEGMDLELEATIDFTDPKDPHPWVESEYPASADEKAPSISTPSVIRKDGMVYRETAPSRGSSFSYRIGEFKHPGDFYLMEMEYPDNADRWADVIISSKAQGVWSNSQSGVGYTTGGKFHVTGTMQKLYWIHVADPGVHSVDVVNGQGGTRAAAARLTIYHVRGDLPPLQTGSERMSGIHSERCYPTSGMGMNFGIGQPGPKLPRDEQEKQWARPLMERYIEELVFLRETAERYVQYLRFVGQNSHIMGCFQYSEGNTPYVPAPRMEGARMPGCLRSMFAHVADLNGVSVYAGLETSKFDSVSTNVNNLQVARGSDTVWMVDEDGRQYYYYRYHPECTVQNWAHPLWRGAFNEMMKNLSRTYGHLPHFKGVHILLGPSQKHGYYPPAFVDGNKYDQPFFMSYDDESFRQFEADMSLRLPFPREDPERFAKRAALVRNDAFRTKFRQWRCGKLKQVLVEARDSLNLQAGRSDLQVVEVAVFEVPRFFQEWKGRRADFRDFARDFGFDLGLYRNVPGLFLGRWTIGWAAGGEQNPFLWAAKEDPGVTSAFDDPLNRYVLCRTSWDENATIAPGQNRSQIEKDGSIGTLLPGSDWVMNNMRVRALPQAGGYHCREPLIQALITADPNVLMTGFTDLNINVGHEDRLRPFWAAYTSLPREKFEPVLGTDLAANVAIRQLTRKAETWFYVANPAYWHIRAEIRMETPGAVYRVPGNAPAVLRTEGRERMLSVSLEPYGLAAFRVDSPRVAIRGYRTGQISEQEQGHMDGIIARARVLLADPTVNIILPPGDRSYMQTILQSAEQSIQDREYARAWSLLKDAQFWWSWKQYLEKAVQAAALLPETFPVTKQENITGLPVITVLRAKGPISVDGALDETEWRSGPFSGGFVTRDRKPALAETAVAARYDEKNLYLAFVCADREPEKLKAQATKESEVFAMQDDAIAIFLQPREEFSTYYQMAFNTRGVLFDQRVVGAERDYVFQPHWKAAVRKEKGWWTAEVSLPWEAFGVAPPQAGSWRVNFHRIVRDNLVDSGSWSFSENNWHWPERFGKMALER